MTSTKTPARSTGPSSPSLPKLSAALKARYEATLDPDYWGRKTTYLNRNGQTVTRPLVINPKKSLNYWKEKCGTNMKRKLDEVSSLWQAYKRDDIPYADVIHYFEPLRAKRIREHNAGRVTIYYVSRWDARVEQVMFDFDNKKHLPDYDTHAAAQHINHLFDDQQFIQPSTSLSGTHAYLWIEAEDEEGLRIPLDERKRWYKRCIRVCRIELQISKFRCWRELDSLKGVAAKVSWQKSEHPADQKRPYYLRYERGGRLAKLPLLSNEQDEQRYLNRKIITWNRFCQVVSGLETKHQIGVKYQREAAGYRSIVSISAETDSERKNGVTIDQMLLSTDKQRVALGCVFRFQQVHGRNPDDTEMQTLNVIYNQTPTHTGTLLTKKRVHRFRKAISFSSNRPIIGHSITSVVATVETNLKGYIEIDHQLQVINEKLVRLKQRKVEVRDIALVYCYLRNNVVTNEGYVPRDSLLALSAREQKRRKLSAHAIAAIMKLLIDLKLVLVVSEACKARPGVRGVCTRYSLTSDLAVAAVALTDTLRHLDVEDEGSAVPKPLVAV